MSEHISYTLDEIGRKIDALLNLENRKELPVQNGSEADMSLNNSRIRRHVRIKGVLVWVSANDEQDYVDKIIKLSGSGSEETPVKEKHNFKSYAENWFEVYSKPNVQRVTASGYRMILNGRLYPILGAMDIEDVHPIDVQAVFNSYPEGTKQQTKIKCKHVLNQIFKAALDEGLIQRNPLDSGSIKIGGVASEETKPYTLEQMQYLAAHLNDIPNPTERTWLALSISLPLRPEEILGLRWEDVDEIHKTVYVRNVVIHPHRNEPEFKPYPKTASSRRTLVLPEKIFSILPKRGRDDEFLIGGSEPPSYTKLRGMCKRINLATGFGETILPRRFRTTVATDISAMTHDLKLVQRMLGHSTPEMTLKHYDKGRSTSVDAAEAISKCYGF